jgi:hypothetical protein
MKITDKRAERKKIYFRTIPVGTVFSGGNRKVFYVKVVASPGGLNAVNLETGVLTIFGTAEDVTPYFDAEMVIK